MEIDHVLRVVGGQGALDRLVPLVYAEPRRLAHRSMRGERPGHSPQTAALSHEAPLRLWQLAKVWLLQRLEAR